VERIAKTIAPQSAVDGYRFTLAIERPASPFLKAD
jgi:hypothetical protein